MTVDARALIATDLGILKDGSGLSEDHLQDIGLIKYRGTFTFDGVLTPARGRVIQVAYARPQYGASGLLTRFYPRLHVISSTANPYENETTVEVGCRLELMKDKKDQTTFQAGGQPPAWWQALAADSKNYIAPVIQAQDVIAFCLSALGISLAAGSAVSVDAYSTPEIDLSQGYVTVLDDMLKSSLLFGHMTPAGELLVRSVTLTSGTGPVLTRDRFLKLTEINAQGGSEQFQVSYESVQVSPNVGDTTGPTPGPGLVTAAGGKSIRYVGTQDTGNLGNSDQRKIRDWEKEVTYAPPAKYDIVYSDPTGAQIIQSFGNVPSTESATTFCDFSWTDSTGARRTQSVVQRRTSTTKGCLAEANPSLGTSFLENGLGFAGSQQDDQVETTDYTYELTADGPRVISETSETKHTGFRFAGSLGIQNYVIDGTPLSLSGQLFVVSRQISEYEYNDGEGLVKRSVTRFAAIGKKQSGSQGSGVGASRSVTVTDLAEVVNAAIGLVCEGTEINISIGREGAVQSRASRQQLSNQGSLTTTARKTVTGNSALGSDTSGILWTTSSYGLPYAPDDIILAENVAGGVGETINSYIVSGESERRALALGELQNALEFGHANGVQITTAAWELPSRPFEPVFLEVSNLSTAFRVNGRSWTIQNGAVIVSADLCLVGTAGKLSGGTPIAWMPLPGPASALPTLSAAGGSGDILPANTITLPGGFNPAAPGSVWSSLPTNGSDTYGVARTASSIAPPFIVTAAFLAISRSVVEVTELTYGLAPVTDSIVAVSKSKVTVENGEIESVSRTIVELTEEISGGGGGDSTTVTTSYGTYTVVRVTGTANGLGTALTSMPWYNSFNSDAAELVVQVNTARPDWSPSNPDIVSPTFLGTLVAPGPIAFAGYVDYGGGPQPLAAGWDTGSSAGSSVDFDMDTSYVWLVLE